jgi:hypothetical protein
MSAFLDLNASGKLEIDLYFDFQCSFAYQTSLWLRDVVELMGDDLVDLRFHFFSLAQANRTDESWNIWDTTPEDPNAHGLLAFLAGAAALKSGGQRALNAFYLELGKLHHQENQPLDKATILEAAQTAEVNVNDAFNGSDPYLAAALKESHTGGVEKYGVFGSSTVVFEERYGLYIQIMPRPAYDKVLPLFQHIQMLAMVDRNVFEIKRVQTLAEKEELKETIQNLYTN